MRELLFMVVLAVILLTYTVCARAWTLVWEAPTEGGPVAGYTVEISIDDRNTWPYIYNTPETSLPLDDKCRYGVNYSFRVSAYNAAGASAPCEPIDWTRPAYVPPDENPLPDVAGSPPTDPQNGQVQ